MNSDEVNWLLQTIEDPENAKRFVQAQHQRGKNPISPDGEFSSGPELDGLACSREPACVDFSEVHCDTANCFSSPPLASWTPSVRTTRWLMEIHTAQSIR